VTAYLAASGDRARPLADDLLSSAPSESGVFATLHAVTRGAATRLVLGDPIDLGVSWEQQAPEVLEPTGAMISAAVSVAQQRRSGLAFIHTHPHAGAPPGLSAIDTHTTRRLGAAFAELLDGPFVSVVVGPAGWAGVEYQNGRLAPLERICLAGRRLEIHGDSGGDEHEALDDRQRRALGSSGNAVLRGLRVGIVGVGGLGAPLAETLARMGLGSLTLVDDDLLELSNVRRVFAVTRDDAELARPKVDAVAAGLRRLGLGTSVCAVHGDVRDPQIQQQLLNCDVLFSATDTHSSRAAMTELAVRGCHVLIDLGVRVGIRGGGELDSLLFERRIQLPDGPCLWCWGRLDAHRIRVELMSTFERDALLAEGYVTGIAGEPEPSVAALTVAAAGAGAAALLGLLSAGLEHAPLGSSFELLRSEAYSLDRDEPDPECICARWRA
jgi:ThiF family